MEKNMEKKILTEEEHDKLYDYYEKKILETLAEAKAADVDTRDLMRGLYLNFED